MTTIHNNVNARDFFEINIFKKYINLTNKQKPHTRENNFEY